MAIKNSSLLTSLFQKKKKREKSYTSSSPTRKKLGKKTLGTKRGWFRRRFTLYTKTAQAEQPPQINNPFRKIVRARSISVSIYRFEESGLYLRLGLRHDIIGRATLNRSKRREWGEPPFPPLPPPETGDAEGRRRDRIIFDHEK